ncbi:MAG: PEP-CTERM sorting domain-containing protein [Armatimonadetes bacterium]|nr:PEP-CTERM sorting domain-containing protein [Armatimonadota bacterium]MBX3109093.1 PEP-CTERM sorting domain-containing protein [Fimbriimonadaceae bacterium]
MKTFALFGLLGFGCMAHALMIDDFSTGNINDQISTGSNSTYTAASVPGGNRWVYHSISANPLGLTHSNVVINGIFASDSKTSVDAGSIIGYGSDSAGSFTVGTDLNLDLSTQNAFNINVLSNDLAATIQIAIRTNGGNLAFSSLHNLTPGMVMTPQVVTISFAEFGAQNFADVDSIGIYLDTTASGDTVIDSFEAVPEPASLIALGLGAAALVARKRK